MAAVELGLRAALGLVESVALELTAHVIPPTLNL
jgi:hypothetical protein